MPFKRNPINAEKIDSLARLLAQYPRLAWDNAANSMLERTLDDSANRRSFLPETFLVADEILDATHKILTGLEIDLDAIQRNFIRYAPFAAVEPLLMVVCKKGADRQAIHERMRQHSMKAWNSIRSGEPNLLIDDISQDSEILGYLPETEIRRLMDANQHLGDATQRALAFARSIRDKLG